MEKRNRAPTLHQLLLERAFAPRSLARRRQLIDEQPLDRRRFLLSSGSLGAAAYGFTRSPLTPHFARNGAALLVFFDRWVWKIDPALFGTAATVHWTEGPNKTFLIDLRRAVLPGTDADVSFRARLIKRRGVWGIRISIPSRRFDTAAAFGAWLSGEERLEASASAKPIKANGAEFTFDGPASLTVNPSFGFDFVSRGGRVRHAGLFTCDGAALSLDVNAAGDGALRAVVGGDEHHATRFELIDVRVGDSHIALNSHVGKGLLACCCDASHALTGELFSPHGRGEGIVLLEGPMRLRRGLAIADACQLRLERGALMMAIGGDARHLGIAGRVQRAPYTIDAGRCQVTVAGDDERPFFMDVREGQDSHLIFQARAEGGWVSIPGADRAELALPRVPIEVRFGPGGKTSTTPSDEDKTLGALIVLDNEPFVLLPFEGATLRVRRGLDLVDLKFKFTGFRYQVIDGNGWLVRSTWDDIPRDRLPKTPPNPHTWPAASVTVVFPPQHVAERIYVEEDTTFDPISESRLSAPSRVVFELPEEKSQRQWARQPLTVEGLTDWAELCLHVSTRAQEPDVNLEKQLCDVGIDADTRASELPGIIAAQLHPPKHDETALVMSGRLVLSPSRSAKWITPRRALDPSHALLWHARLDPKGRKTVRALWSDLFTPGTIPKSVTDQDLLLPLSQANHWGLLVQSGIYGMPALMALDDKRLEFRGRPPSRVARPKDVYDILKDHETGPIGNEALGESGFAVPVPFEDADIILTSQGGSLIADWGGEPPHLLTEYLVNVQGVELERLRYRSYLGRDIRVEAVDKGFVLPLGIRCSHVTIVERRFFRHPNRKLGYPVAYPIRRNFLVFGRQPVSIPGINHPFEGRTFPAKQIQMLTTKSPDLRDKGGDSPTLVDDNGNSFSLPGRVFWPKVAKPALGAPDDVEFQWTVDGDLAPIKSNLLFVANGVLSELDHLKAIVKYYRALKGVDIGLRTAKVGGARRRYAAERNAGDTSFDTDSWLLSTTGRIVPNPTGRAGDTAPGEQESFLMDAPMEGHDQPPFYPVMESARITVQSLDRLLGRPQGLISVGFTPQYVRHAFDGSNPSEIYLSVLGPDIALDVSGQGDAAGGVAKPNSLVVALSRKSGVVGGTRAPAPVPPPPNRLAMALADGPKVSFDGPPMGATGPYDFTHALAGRFEPSEFLGGLANAKLLGLIPLKLILAAVGFDQAPKLLEQYGYGPANAIGDAALQTLKQILTSALSTRVKSVVDGLETLPYFAELYPTLVQQLRAFRSAVSTTVDAVQQAHDIVAASGAVTGLVKAGNGLLLEIERTIAHPLPDIIQTELTAFRAAWSVLRTGLTEKYFVFGNDIYSTAIEGNFEAMCQELSAGLGEVLFALGPDEGQLTAAAGDLCKEITKAPEDALRRLERSLFVEQFGKPVRDMLTGARRLRAEATGDFTWARSQFRGFVRGEILSLLQTYRTELAQPTEGEAGELHKAIEALVSAIDKDMAAFVEHAKGTGAPQTTDDVSRRLDGVSKAVAGSEWKDKIAEDVVSHALAFKAASAGQANALLTELERALTERVRVGIVYTTSIEINRIKSVLAEQGAVFSAQAIKRMLEVVQQTLSGIGDALDFADIAAAGRALPGWCAYVAGQVSPVLQAIDAVAQSTIAESAELVTNLSDLETWAANIKLDSTTLASDLSADLTAQLTRAIAGLRTAIQQVTQTRGELDRVRDQVIQLRERAVDVCAAPQDLLRPVARLMQLRADSATRIAHVVEGVVAMHALIKVVEAAPATFKVPMSQVIDVQKTVAPIQRLLFGVTSIQAVMQDPTWNAINVLLEPISKLPVAGYTDALKAQLAKVRGRAQELYRTQIEISTLLDFAREVQQYSLEYDKQLVALVAQTMVFGDDLRKAVEVGAKGVVSAVASAILPAHRLAVNTLGTIVAAFQQEPLRMLINPAIVRQLDAGQQEASDDQTTLASLTGNNPNVSDAAKLAKEWGARTPAVVRVVNVLVGLVESILKGDVSAVLNLQIVKDQLAALEAQARELLQEMVPTRVKLNYDWQTQLNQFPDSDPVFFMRYSAPDDLTISAEVSVDLLTGRRESSVVGTMRPFSIKLLGERLDIATISFEGASFKSLNGNAPTLKADISDVKIGSMIQFLQPLQSWLSPGGDGFYVRPVLNPPGLEAGYAFDSDVIPLGAILFINIALGVSIRLPFTDHPALASFNFATPERPFMISAPPYGGGGYFMITANATGIVEFRMELVFGAVVAISFGPLSAQGRVVAGIYVIQRADGGRTIGALVEAVGEGHIACFGICVSIRVFMQKDDDDGDSLKGGADFSYKFSLGLTSVTFSFHAGYHAKNNGGTLGDSGGVLMMNGVNAREVASLEPTHYTSKYRVSTPNKTEAWTDYSANYFAGDLI
ncbi:MAG TPA: hypothetical protein VK636_15410 [Gemmatimonadaceae bacterium]|nr:hypothetical protein [Gemmatimonadaceae bacterium]